jgi:amino-acid N-acetyltransferase
VIRKAAVKDVAAIQTLVNHFASMDEMLPRSLSAIFENVRDFYVFEKNGQVLGCCALHVIWEDLAEIKSLAVDEAAQGIGVGKQLMDACLKEAAELGVNRVFALTYRPSFFERFEFTRVDKATLPHKIWSDCINCPKFPDCGEEAVIRDL